jgi:N-acetylglucosaminyldiphosphoundecaprenol N-acetyl-beta-D-mannosaminyltransferase
MFKVFGCPIANLSLEQVAAQLREYLAQNKQHLVVTANPEILTYAYKHPKYAQVISQASLLIPDGIGVVLASYLSPQPLRQGRVTGVELVRKLIKESGQYGYSVYLVGSQTKDILYKATQNLSKDYGKINIVGYKTGPFFSSEASFPLKSADNDELLKDITELRPDILLVAFGHPKQELWLDYYMSSLPVKIGIGIGGTLDYLAGICPEAPKLFKKMGLEWFWRLITRPKLRFSRIFKAIIVFPVLYLVSRLKQMFHVEHFNN